MRILLLAGANSIHTVKWVNQFIENGNEVHLCFLPNHKPNIDKINPKANLHELAIKSNVGYYLNMFQIRKLIKQIKPDILNAHYASGYGTLGRLSGFSPYVISVYGSDVYDFPYKNKFSNNLVRKNLLAADQITSTSKAMARQVERLVEIRIPDENVTPFGIDINKFKKLQTVSRNDGLILGSIKTLAPKYGMKFGILAVDHLVHEILPSLNIETPVKYLIYGDGIEKEELKKLVIEKNLEGIVEFKGKIPNDEVPAILNTFDIFLGNSIFDSESFGVAIVEAMACEVPVIVTDVDGFKEVVDSGKAGLMVPRKDFVAMTKNIYDLMKDPNLRAELGRIERKRVLENYNWFENAKTLEAVFRTLIK